jgi:hypothetical protein
MMMNIEIIGLVATRLLEKKKLRILVENKSGKIWSLWIDASEVIRYFEQDGRHYVLAVVRRKYLIDNGVKPALLIKRYPIKDKRDMNGYLTSLKEIVYNRIDRMKIKNEKFKTDVIDAIDMIEEESERMFPNKGFPKIRRTYLSLISSWETILRRKARDQKSDARRKQDELNRHAVPIQSTFAEQSRLNFRSRQRKRRARPA